ncbi:DUF4922 domain-containing protein [Alistipes sp.]|uniref:DUF4922 domain-containing protein n=1 Tax=Alistipes sp. TaxID=1872444 RepID=UPI0025C51275|nr:DUF4922 domain-containing protein [Alistipes sp.]
MKQRIQELFEQQTGVWETLRDNYAALDRVRVKTLHIGEATYKVQFNPARIVSSGAKVDKQTIAARQCFLCAANRPAEQRGIPFKERYTILINPFPIFPRHLTIPDNSHTAQSIVGRIDDMLDLAAALPDFTVFYNGPRCGASAPDHAHFQAGSRRFMPIESQWRTLTAAEPDKLRKARLHTLKDLPRTTLVIESEEKADAAELFALVYDQMALRHGGEEPMMNLLALHEENRWVLFIFPRAKHRPSCYTAEGEARLLSSPASVDMGGVFITPLEHDFEKMDSEALRQILGEVCLPHSEFGELTERIRKKLCTR